MTTANRSGRGRRGRPSAARPAQSSPSHAAPRARARPRRCPATQRCSRAGSSTRRRRRCGTCQCRASGRTSPPPRGTGRRALGSCGRGTGARAVSGGGIMHDGRKAGCGAQGCSLQGAVDRRAAEAAAHVAVSALRGRYHVRRASRVESRVVGHGGLDMPQTVPARACERT